MPELIDREAVLDELHELLVKAPWLGDDDEEEWRAGYEAGLRVAEAEVKNAIRCIDGDFRYPVVHDRWEKVEFDDGHGPYYLYEHKNCGCIMARKRNYCPDCGSVMDGEQDA